MKETSNILKGFFKAQGLTQQDIADKLGVTQGYVALMLNGKINFGRTAAEKWQKEFGLSAAWLMTGEGNMLAEPATNSSSATLNIGSNNTVEGDNNSVGNTTTTGDLNAQLLKIFQEQQRQNAEWQNMVKDMIGIIKEGK